ncbi:MAG TPA: nucleoside recognition domain-containing protein [Limnochordales bacterium]
MTAAWLDGVARWAVPAMIGLVVGIGASRGVPVYESFVRGAKSGLAVTLRVLPYMVAMLSATELFQQSGAMELVMAPLRPLTEWLGIPSVVLPMAIIRPLSGSAASGYLAHLLQTHGPDSLVGRLASVMQGSTETTFYVITVYLGSVGIRDPRWALTAGLLADAAGLAASVVAIRLMGWQ